MIDDETRKSLLARLNRAEGQVAAIRRMIEDGSYCVNVLTQVSAAQGALGRVGEIVLQNHLDHCVTAAIEAGDDEARQAKVEELKGLVVRYGFRRNA